MLNTDDQEKNEIELQRNRFLCLWLAPMSFYGYALIVVGPFIPIVIATLITTLHIKIGGYKDFFRLPLYIISMHVTATLMPVIYLFYSVFFEWENYVLLLIAMYFSSLVSATFFVVFYKNYSIKNSF